MRKVFEGEPYEFTTVLEDYRNTEIPAIAHFNRKFRQRLYSVMFHDKPTYGEAHFVPEWCMTGPGSLNRVMMREVEQAPEFHPGLEALWNNQDDAMLDVRLVFFGSTKLLQLWFKLIVVLDSFVGFS